MVVLMMKLERLPVTTPSFVTNNTFVDIVTLTVMDSITQTPVITGCVH